MLEVGTPVEIRCHGTCPWTGGWEVADIVVASGAWAYRVRRLGMLRALDLPLPASDVRAARVPALSRAG